MQLLIKQFANLKLPILLLEPRASKLNLIQLLNLVGRRLSFDNTMEMIAAKKEESIDVRFNYLKRN